MYILVVIITIIFVKESKHKALLQFIKVWSCIKCKHNYTFQTNSTLQVLYLAWNGFSNCGCREIGTALQTNSTLELLDLSNNRVGLEGAKWLAKGLMLNSKLRHLMVFVDSDSLLQLNCFFFNPILSLNFSLSLSDD